MSEQQHPAPTPARSLGLLSLNVNGLTGERKRNAFFHQMINSSNLAIIAGQESHHVSDREAQRWASGGAGKGMPWAGQHFWNGGEERGASRSCGVFVLIKANAEVSNARAGYSDAAGRLLRVDFVYGGQQISLLNVYAPATASERVPFFDTEIDKALEGAPGAVIVCGDFNCIVQEVDHNSTGPAGNSNSHFTGRDKLQRVMLVHQLYDGWREMHGATERMYTHTGTNGLSRARLDRWLVADDLRTWVHRTDRLDTTVGDHAGVTLTLRPTDLPPMGPGTWSLPPRLLNDGGYVTLILSTVPLWLEARGPESARDRWEGLKQYIKIISSEYSRTARRGEREKERKLREGLRRAQKVLGDTPGDAAASVQEAQLESSLRDLLGAKAAADKQAADALWQVYGESSTAWFHMLVSSKNGKGAAMGAISHVKNSHGVELSLAAPEERSAAEAALVSFWSGIFAKHPASIPDQDLLLDAVDLTLGPESAAAAEGPAGAGLVTAACLQEALKTAPTNKRPGSDGLPYEFYEAFWDLLEAPLVAAAAEVFTDTGSMAPLPKSMREGIITLIFKGGGKDRRDPATYRPITLLNVDYKLIAKAIAARMAGPLDTVVDVTQTAFLPGRHIGDNVMYHLEEVDYLERVQQPGCILFLDFEKAFDRVDREWLHRCVERLGFGAHMKRWVRVLLSGTQARVAYNGFTTPHFPIEGGVAQGSPLSPLIFTLQAQPLAALLRKLQRHGVFKGIELPDKSQAPPSHQHADDTTLHVATREDAAVAVDKGVNVYCRASASLLNISKSQGMMLGPHDGIQGRDQVTGAEFLAPGACLRHLGVLLARPGDQKAAAKAMYTKRVGTVQGSAVAWGKHCLSFLGRVYVSKQVMASSIYFHAGYVKPLPEQMAALVGIMAAFTAKPVPALDGSSRAATHPARAVAALPPRLGGIGGADLTLQVDALLAKNVARLLHPSRHPWKVLMRHALQRENPSGLGAALPLYRYAALAAIRSQTASKLSYRHASYVRGMLRLEPVRRTQLEDMSFHQVMLEPLTHNPCITNAGGMPILPSAPLGKCLLQAGLKKVSDLRTAHHTAGGGGTNLDAAVAQAMTCLPAAWRTHVGVAQEPAAAAYCSPDQQMVASHQDMQQTGAQLHTVLPDGRLQRIEPADWLPQLDASQWQPCLVLSVPKAEKRVTRREKEERREDPDKPPPTETFLAGPWADQEADPSAWNGATGEPLSQFVVRDAALRMKHLQLLDKFKGYNPAAGMRPTLWLKEDGSGGLAALETKWEQKVQLQQAGQGGSNTGSQQCQRHEHSEWEPPAWLRSSFTHEAQANHRVQQQASQGDGAEQAGPSSTQHGPQPSRQQLQQQQQPRGVETGDRVVAASVRIQPLEAQGHQQTMLPPYAAAWERLRSKRLPNEVRAVGWRLMHGSLHCGAFTAYVFGKTAEEAHCTAPCCQQKLETLTHLFMDCPCVAPAVDWLLDWWEKVGGDRPPRDGRVLLADDHRVWRPCEGLDELWTLARLELLHSIWSLRCARRERGAKVQPAAVAAMTVSRLKRHLELDWLRCYADVRTLSVACRALFRGRDPSLTREAFVQRWGTVGVLCAVSDDEDGPLALKVKLSTSMPVPVPAVDPVLNLPATLDDE